MNTKTEKPVVHTTQKEIEAEVNLTLDEDSPLPFTNKIVTEQIGIETGVDSRGFLSKAVTMKFEDFEKYSEYMVKGGFTYNA